MERHDPAVKPISTGQAPAERGAPKLDKPRPDTIGEGTYDAERGRLVRLGFGETAPRAV
jgi:hypothetical protein